MGTKFFNTLTREIEAFSPLREGEVRIYTCGPTAYDFAHIGNFRTYIFQDILRRWLGYRGYRVFQVMNITDVDDKTIRGSRSAGLSLSAYTERYIKAFFEDKVTLNIEPAEVYPRATEHIQGMVRLVKRLLERGYAYRGLDGSIYYRISSFPEYGKLSRISIEGLKAGASERVKTDEYGKEKPQDFALWKAWDSDDGDVFWETAIGKGRPGWHLECSAMSMQYLGETFDIHSGGVDLIFPHHENEIAQSEAATGKTFARYWLHCEHLIVEGRKMSKSLGNFYTLRDLLEKGFSPLAIRFVLLSTHYRQQLNFTFTGLEAAENAVQRLLDFAQRLNEVRLERGSAEAERIIEESRRRFEASLDNDLDINGALAAVFEFVKATNKLIDGGAIGREEAQKAYSLLLDFDKVLGVLSHPAAKSREEKLPPEVEELIRLREEARRRRDWEAADKIRKQLAEMGILLEDTPAGVRWKRKI